MASLMPLQKSISPWKNPPQLRPFVQQDFMKTLEKAGPQLTSRLKGDWIGLYRCKAFASVSVCHPFKPGAGKLFEGVLEGSSVFIKLSL